MIDEKTKKNIATLHPKLRVEATSIYEKINKALTGRAIVRFTSTLRRFGEQDKLYAQGRTEKGSIVTKAKGGQSYHNYGLAIDIVLLVDKDKNGTHETAVWDVNTDFDADRMADWIECVLIFKKYGWEWGGDWAFKDYPHFQKTFGLTTKTLLEKHNGNKVNSEGYVII
jgi:peptidoglycan L-alanyl-D-glutamate endopeptidase CwlK